MISIVATWREVVAAQSGGVRNNLSGAQESCGGMAGHSRGARVLRKRAVVE